MPRKLALATFGACSPGPRRVFGTPLCSTYDCHAPASLPDTSDRVKKKSVPFSSACLASSYMRQTPSSVLRITSLGSSTAARRDLEARLRTIDGIFESFLGGKVGLRNGDWWAHRSSSLGRLALVGFEYIGFLCPSTED